MRREVALDFLEVREAELNGFLDYVPIISAVIFAGILGVALLQFSMVRKSMRIQTEQQIYARIMEARLKLENTDAFTNMAKESPDFAERFALVDTPDQYYVAVAFLDLFEFIHRLKKTKMIDAKLWDRWKKTAKLLMTIPKFKKLWVKIKQSHSPDFIDFIDSL